MILATERLEVRLPAEDKALLTRAAEIEGVKTSQFVLALALERARKVVAQSEAPSITTNATGYQQVLDALANPPGATETLVNSMRKYTEMGIEWR